MCGQWLEDFTVDGAPVRFTGLLLFCSGMLPASSSTLPQLGTSL